MSQTTVTTNTGLVIREVQTFTSRAEWEHLLRFGFAPGEYMFRCTGCKDCWNGVDKRAAYCFECATKRHDAYVEEIKAFDPLVEIQKVARIVGNTREHQKDVLASALEELGELSVEVRIAHGTKPGPAGVDGIVGEAIDLILCGYDMIHTELGELDPDVIYPIMKKKLAKWQRKYSK
jgi:hypothetical protein